MRTRATLSVAAVVAGLAAVPAATASAAPTAAPAATSRLGPAVEAAGPARTAAVSHALAAVAAPGEAFSPTGVLVDTDGTTHVRMVRTYRGLPVLGGDVVVHQGRAGDLREVSRTLATRDLYGTGSPEYNAVAAAWSAVSVN
jgi:Zn-dependent metalloprotease